MERCEPHPPGVGWRNDETAEHKRQIRLPDVAMLPSRLGRGKRSIRSVHICHPRGRHGRHTDTMQQPTCPHTGMD